MNAMLGTGTVQRGDGMEAVPQREFDDLYTAVYAVLDKAKPDHRLVKMYKGSPAATDPHPTVTEVGRFFYTCQRGLLAYVCRRTNPTGPPVLHNLDVYDATHQPRVLSRAVFEQLFAALARSGETAADVLTYVTGRRHPLGAYRGGSSGFDEEARAAVAAHFNSAGVPATVADVTVFSSGAKGAFLAFFAAMMCHRDHETIRHRGGTVLAPAGFYQSMRLIPPLYGGTIQVVPQLSGPAVADWLATTMHQRRRCVYVPLVNNADGAVLDRERAHGIARAILTHNATHPGRPVYVLADDVYVDCYLDPTRPGVPIGSVSGCDLNAPELGRMSDWTFTVVTPSKTFALPTSRIAFGTTTNPELRRAVEHYRTSLALSRVPVITELTAAAAICLTPTSWISRWIAGYRQALDTLAIRLDTINHRLGYRAVWADPVDGGWYLPLRINRRLLPSARSSFDAYAALLRYSPQRDSGIGMLPGELFGYRDVSNGFLLRGNIAIGDAELARFADRLDHAVALWSGPDGGAVVAAALEHARTVADVDAILTAAQY
jgi:aspartate/methionine/tyrosine aminotransferase